MRALMINTTAFLTIALVSFQLSFLLPVPAVVDASFDAAGQSKSQKPSLTSS